MDVLSPTEPLTGSSASRRLRGDSLARDYRRMEDTLHWLAQNFERQPSLDEIAAQAGLTPYHFQRVFSRWVGLSPKKLVQFLSLDAAKRRLDASESILDAAFDAGLSGAGRLHDLFVSLEAVTPGEYKRQGEGLTVRYGYHPSPFGDCLVLATARGICGLGFVVDGDRAGALESLQRGFEQARFQADAAHTEALARRIFRPAPTESVPPLKLLVQGSRFQLKVWEALLKVPPGAVVSYSALARRLDRPEAVRAVAGAVARNPLSYLIPCHRVIRQSGLLGGYRWGVPRKLAILTRETVRAELASGRVA